MADMFLKILLILAALSAVFGDQGGKRLWTPQDGRTRDEWMKCNGLPPDSCKRMQTKMKRVNELLGINVKSEDKKPQERKSSGIEELIDIDLFGLPPDNAIDDTLMTEEEVDYIIQHAEHDNETNVTKRRRKRQLIDFKDSLYDRSWKSFMPIVYKFDGSHDSAEQDKIRESLQIWSSNTCVRFREISMESSYDKSHILFVKGEWGTCESFVGRVRDSIQQPIYLGGGCFYWLSVTRHLLHAVGHALGLYNEQQRTDRDSYITVFPNNILESEYRHFVKFPTDNVVPYHLTSVMHDGNRHGQINSNVNTMETKDPLYSQSMTNRVELTFDDAHAINIAYECDSLCSSSPPVSCQRGGYRDPNNCARCKCPKGFGGDFCQRVADPVNAVCGGTHSLGATEQLTIKSPGYPLGYSPQSHECSWLFTCPPQYHVRLQFDPYFGFMHWSGGCGSECPWHWVEVKFKRDLGLEGARFCCGTLPSFILSESHEMLVNFKVHDIGSSSLGFSANIMCEATTATTPTPPAAPCACVNGGACVLDQEGKLKCVCPCGYSGRLCQNRDAGK